LEAPTPVFPAPAFRCADWFDRANPICTGGTMINRAQMDQLRAPVLAVFASFMRQVAGVYVWDPLPPLCPGQVCSASQSGRPLFFDGDHLSAHGDLLLLPDFLRFIRALPAAPAGHAGSGV